MFSDYENVVIYEWISGKAIERSSLKTNRYGPVHQRDNARLPCTCSVRFRSIWSEARPLKSLYSE